jgi:hypothetical protein
MAIDLLDLNSHSHALAGCDTGRFPARPADRKIHGSGSEKESLLRPADAPGYVATWAFLIDADYNAGLFSGHCRLMS